MLQGYCLLIVNYRGSIGFGENFLNSLLGEIANNDVHDCGELALSVIDKYKEIVDPRRIGLQGGSHGGFLIGWLVGHEKYKNLWAAAALRNPVLNMSYMINATDIPDWIYACCLKQEFKFSELKAEENTIFF